MEIKQKLSFLSVIFATILLASCGSTETTDDMGGGSKAGSGSSSSTQGASTEAGAGQEVDKSGLQDMLTLYYFDFDESTLTAETRAGLDVAAGILKASGKSVRLEGHADERGTTEYNLALGERRAQAVANYLGTQGVDKSKLEVISYGESKPVMTGSDEASWAKNRRVELVK